MPEEHEDAVTTEAEALADILAWSATRPLWQRDALRRLTEPEELTDQEIDDLADLCKDQTLPATPLRPAMSLPPMPGCRASAFARSGTLLTSIRWPEART